MRELLTFVVHWFPLGKFYITFPYTLFIPPNGRSVCLPVCPFVCLSVCLCLSVCTTDYDFGRSSLFLYSYVSDLCFILQNFFFTVMGAGFFSPGYYSAFSFFSNLYTHQSIILFKTNFLNNSFFHFFFNESSKPKTFLGKNT